MSDNNVNTIVIGGNEPPKRSFILWHILHALLTILTAGLWLPIWILHFVIWLSVR